MFLAIKEMRYSKLRYALIIGVMILISYVVLMLSGLANGLASEFEMAITDWQAKSVVINKDANKLIAASQLNDDDLKDVQAQDKAPVGIYSGVVTKQHEKTNISVFGTTKSAFMMPKVQKGRQVKAQNEVIISQNLADKGFKIGDTLKLGGQKTTVEIVGIFKSTYYTVTPVIYTDLTTWRTIKYGEQTPAASQFYNLVVTKQKPALKQDAQKTTLQQMSVPTLIENLPGYSAQNLTLNAMVYFLFVIVVAIIGIFMYVMTLQKTQIFGVMKAQGISNWFITKSILAQSFIVGLVGVIIAFGLAFGTSLILPAAMPFTINLTQWFLYSGILLVVAILGGIFSIGTITKVDPITAIGG